MKHAVQALSLLLNNNVAKSCDRGSRCDVRITTKNVLGKRTGVPEEHNNRLFRVFLFQNSPKKDAVTGAKSQKSFPRRNIRSHLGKCLVTYKLVFS